MQNLYMTQKNEGVFQNFSQSITIILPWRVAKSPRVHEYLFNSAATSPDLPPRQIS